MGIVLARKGGLDFWKENFIVWGFSLALGEQNCAIPLFFLCGK